MNNLQSNDLMALSFLINEEIYLIKGEVINNSNAFIQSEIEKKVEDVLVKVEETKSDETKSKDKIEQVLNEKVVQKNQTPDFKYLGENNKYILIIVKEPGFDFLKQEDLGFLLKILAAKKLELKDVAIINIENHNSLNFINLKAFFACNKIITFGINPQILQIESAVANKKSLFKETSILGTWDLAKLQQDVKKKAIFWDELKSF